MLIVALLATTLILLPSVSGIKTNFYRNGFGFSEEIIASDQDEVIGKTVSTADSMSDFIEGQGSLKKEYSIFNTAGCALVGVDIKNSERYSYAYELLSADDSVSASFGSLNVWDAKYIKAYAEARNVKEENPGEYHAEVSTEVKEGSLLGYSNRAEASKNNVDATQWIDSASGKKITLTAIASDGSGNMADASTEVIGTKFRDGYIKNFNSEGQVIDVVGGEGLDESEGYRDVYAMHGPFETGNRGPGFISGNSISSEGSSSSQMGSKSSYSANIQDGSIFGIFDYGAQAYSTGYVAAFPLELPQSWRGQTGSNVLSAKGIQFESWASNGKGESSSEITDAKDVFIFNYDSSSFVSRGNAGVVKSFDTLLGKSIKLSESSSSRTKNAEVNINLKSGYIFGYSDYAPKGDLNLYNFKPKTIATDSSAGAYLNANVNGKKLVREVIL